MSKNYYEAEISRLDRESIKVQMKDQYGNETKWMKLNRKSASAIVSNLLSIFGLRALEPVMYPRVQIMKLVCDDSAPNGIYELDYEAEFIDWGMDVHSERDGVSMCAASFTAAIVKREDGSIRLIHPDFIRFPDK